MIGTAAFTYYKTHPKMLAEVEKQVAIQRLEDAGKPVTSHSIIAEVKQFDDSDVGDIILPHFIVHRLPKGATGLLVAAMSSIDTSLNSSATVLLKDVYRRYFKPDVGERESMIVLYVATTAMGAIGTGIAVAMIGVKSVLDTWWLLSGIFAGGVLGLFLLGMVSRRASKPAAMVSVIIGLVVITWMSIGKLVDIPKSLQNPLHGHMTIVVGTLTIFLIGLLLSKLILSS